MVETILLLFLFPRKEKKEKMTKAKTKAIAKKVGRTKRKKIPYISQTTPINCGPTALYNLVKWRESVRSKSTKLLSPLSLKSLNEECNPNEEYGTSARTFEKVLRKVLRTVLDKSGEDIVFERVGGSRDMISTHNISSHLNSNGVVLLLYYWEPYEGAHYILIDKEVDGKYRVVNEGEVVSSGREGGERGENKSVGVVSKEKLEDMLRKKTWQGVNHPVAWFVK